MNKKEIVSLDMVVGDVIEKRTILDDLTGKVKKGSVLETLHQLYSDVLLLNGIFFKY